MHEQCQLQCLVMPGSAGVVIFDIVICGIFITHWLQMHSLFVSWDNGYQQDIIWCSIATSLRTLDKSKRIMTVTTSRATMSHICKYSLSMLSVRWHHNGRDGVSNHQPHDCLLNRIFKRRSKKISKLRVTGLCVGNSPGADEFPHKWPVTRKMFPFHDVLIYPTRHHLCGLQCLICGFIWLKLAYLKWESTHFKTC